MQIPDWIADGFFSSEPSDFRKIAQGGIGEVYRFTEAGRNFALKRLRPEYAGDAIRRTHFLAELSLLEEINHPRIPRLGKKLIGETELYFAMEWMEGLSLEEVINASPSGLALERAIDYVRQACQILEYLHSFQGSNGPDPIAHGDLKPHNMILSPKGELRLIDFNFSRHASWPAAGVKGTPPYMSPEAFAGVAPNPQSDLCSLSLSLYHWLTGKTLFDEKSSNAYLARWLQKFQYKAIDGQAWPEALKVFFHRALALDPEQRFPDVAAYQAALSVF